MRRSNLMAIAVVVAVAMVGSCTRARPPEPTDPALAPENPAGGASMASMAGMARAKPGKHTQRLSKDARRLEKLLTAVAHCTVTRTAVVHHIAMDCKAYSRLLKARYRELKNKPITQEFTRVGLKHLGHKSAAVRKSALMLLPLHQPDVQRRLLLHAATEADPLVIGQILHDLRKAVESNPQAARYVLRMAEHRHPAVRKSAAATLVSRSWVKGFGLKFLRMMRTEPNPLVRSYLLSWGNRLRDKKLLLSIYEDCSTQPTNKRVYGGCMLGLISLWNPPDDRTTPSPKAYALFVQRVRKNHGCDGCPPLTGVSRDLGRIPKLRRGKSQIVPSWYRRQPIARVLQHTALARHAPYRDRYHAIQSLAKLGAKKSLEKLTTSLKLLKKDPFAERLLGVCQRNTAVR